MKNASVLLVFSYAFFLLPGPGARAEPPAGEAESRAEEPANPGELNGDRRRPPRASSPTHPRPLDRWMEMLRENDPEVHARLEQLRNENPEAFRDALRERLSELRRMRQATPDESPDRRRRWGPDRISRPDAGPESRPHRDPHGERLADIERTLAALADQYRTAHEDRAEIRDALHQTLNQWLDLKQEQTEQRILRAEAQLDQLRRMLNEGQERRAELLERRMEALIGPNPAP